MVSWAFIIQPSFISCSISLFSSWNYSLIQVHYILSIFFVSLIYSTSSQFLTPEVASYQCRMSAIGPLVVFRIPLLCLYFPNIYRHWCHFPGSSAISGSLTFFVKCLSASIFLAIIVPSLVHSYYYSSNYWIIYCILPGLIG